MSEAERNVVFTLLPDGDTSAYFGDHELALDLFEKIVEQAPPLVVWYLARPHLKPLRTNPRFKEIMIASGIVDVWRSSGKWGDFCQPLDGGDDFECF